MKNLFYLLVALFMLPATLPGQITCIQWFYQTEPISPLATNLLLNGGFEQTDCTPGWLDGSFCPSSNLYNCDIESWRCIDGGINSYPVIFDTTLSQIAEGQYAAYFGNGNAFMCAESSFDTSCLIRQGCLVSGFPPGFPTTLKGYGQQEGVSLEQTVDNFVVGETYVLEFWAGGEPLNGLLLSPSIFAVDIGFGKTYLTCLPTEHNTPSTGLVYLIRFEATSVSHTFTFTNWGHMCGDCTEVVLDNVKLYTLAELPGTMEECVTSVKMNSPEDNVTLMPNPANDVIHIEGLESDIFTYSLFAMNGNRVRHASSEKCIDIGTLPAGMYMLLIADDHHAIVKKLMKT